MPTSHRQVTSLGRVGGTRHFYAEIQRFVRDRGGGLVVDVGCGRGRLAQDEDIDRRRLTDLREAADRVVGLDVDPRAAENPRIHEFHLLHSRGGWPISDNAASAVVADWVFEHVEAPIQFLDEAERVLQPGGMLAIRTSNAKSIVSVVAAIVPNRWHSEVLGFVEPGRDRQDVFPTVYALNHPDALVAECERRGMETRCYVVPGLQGYLRRVPSIASAASWVESRLPPNLQHTVLLFAVKPSFD